MKRMKKFGMILLLMQSTVMMAQAKPGPVDRATLAARNKETVKQFLEIVRSGKSPERAREFMADTVLAHQLNAEAPVTVKRSPQNYTEHVQEFLQLFGPFVFHITELLADGDRVYARWIQRGHHLGEIDGLAPTGKSLVEIASAVYRLEHDKIAEYWIQTDRYGFEKQLKEQRT
jgi:predicted ester cyclase